MRTGKEWDLRVTDEIRRFFALKGYSKPQLSQADAETLIRLVCDAYEVSAIPTLRAGGADVVARLKSYRACGCYLRAAPPRYPVAAILTFPTPHVKTILHEVYHHIDAYFLLQSGVRVFDSSNEKGFARTFADRMWSLIVSGSGGSRIVTMKPSAPKKEKEKPTEKGKGKGQMRLFVTKEGRLGLSV